MIRITSDLTNKSYDSLDEARKAEADYKAAIIQKKEADKQKDLTRKADAKAIKDMFAARAEYLKKSDKEINDALAKFNEDHGPFHMSISGSDAFDTFDSFSSFIDSMFDHFWF